MKISRRVVLVVPLFLYAFAPQSPPSQKGGPQTEANLCGLSFNLFTDWVVIKDGSSWPAETCSGAVRPKDFAKRIGADGPQEAWTISIQVWPKPLEDVIERYDPERENGRLYIGMGIAGRATEPAYEIRGPGWQGLRVDEVPFRLSYKEYVSAGSAVFAAISSTRSARTAIVVAVPPSERDALPLLLKSVRFIE